MNFIVKLHVLMPSESNTKVHVKLKQFSEFSLFPTNKDVSTNMMSAYLHRPGINDIKENQITSRPHYANI